MTPAIHTWLTRAVVCTAVLGALLLGHITQAPGRSSPSQSGLAQSGLKVTQTLMLAQDESEAK
jgi:hypothetical protein